MSFETFMRQRAPVTGEPSVTIQKRGTLSLNVPAYSALGSPEAVELLFDRDQRLMALRAVDPSAESAYPIRPLGRGSTWLVSGKAFTKYYGIETGSAHRWTGRVEDGLLIVDLKEPGTDVSMGRSQDADTDLERPKFL